MAARFGLAVILRDGRWRGLLRMRSKEMIRITETLY
jgi:hypothetical protein